MTRFAFALLGTLLAIPAYAADNAVILDPGTTVTMRCKDVGSGVQSCINILGDTAGSPLATAPGSGNSTFALPIQGVTGGVPIPTTASPTTPTTGTLQSAATASGNGTNLVTTGLASAMLTVNCSACSGGTTINFEGTQDGTNFGAISAQQLGLNTVSTTTTTAGVTIWQLSVAGFSAIRARISGYSAGTITVTGTALNAVLNNPISVVNQGTSPWAVRQSSQYPVGATVITASSTGTTAATAATLAGASSVTTYICGFSIRANATAATTGNATVTGTISATMNFTQWVAPAASGVGTTEMIFTPCVPASTTNTAVVVTSVAAGTGGVTSTTAWGYRL